MDRETERRHNTASQKKMYKHEQHSKTTATDRVLQSHLPGTMATCPQACHRWRRLGVSRQRAHGRHHTSTILDRYNPTARQSCFEELKRIIVVESHELSVLVSPHLSVVLTALSSSSAIDSAILSSVLDNCSWNS